MGNYFDDQAEKLRAEAASENNENAPLAPPAPPAPRATPAQRATPAPRATPPPSPTPAPSPAPVASDEVFVPPNVNPAIGIGTLAAGGVLAKKFGPGIVSGAKKVLPKIIKAPLTRGIAGLGTAIAGNELVNYLAPEAGDYSNFARGFGRGAGLALSGATGGYVAGGPVGAIVGAVANPAFDVYKSYQKNQQNLADAQKTDAETAAMLTRTPSAARLKYRAESAKRAYKEATGQDFVE